MSMEELTQGGVVELTPIVGLDTLNLAAKLSADKRKELDDSQIVLDFIRKGKVQEFVFLLD
jgi:hypothetical protein